MSKLTDTLRTVLEPFKFLLDRVEKKIDNIDIPAPVQPDMAQSNPEEPDYIKNRIAYDDRERKLIFEDYVEINRYAGSAYSSDDLDFVLEEGALYEIVFGDDMYIERCTLLEDQYIQVLTLGSPLHSIQCNTLGKYSNAVGDPTFSGPTHLKVSLVDESGGYKTLPKHLVPEYNIASNLNAGVVKVSAVERGVNQNYVLPIIMESTEGIIYAESPLPPYRDDKQTIRWDKKRWSWVADDGGWFKSTNGEYYKLTFEKTTPVFKNENNGTIWSPGTFMPKATTSDSGKVPMVQSDGTWGLSDIPETDLSNYYTKEESDAKALPTATTSDSGKVPMVQSDGTWGLGEVITEARVNELITTAISAIPNAEEVSF